MSLYTVYKNVTLMMKRRGYKYEDFNSKYFDDIEVNTFEFQYKKDGYNIVITYMYRDDGDLSSEVKETEMRTRYEQVTRKYKNVNEIILLTKNPIKSNDEKTVKFDKRVILFEDKFFKYDLTKHKYYSEHIKLTKLEIDELLSSLNLPLNLNLKDKFPMILTTDIVIRYFDYKIGDIIKINSLFYNKVPNYRIVTKVKKLDWEIKDDDEDLF